MIKIRLLCVALVVTIVGANAQGQTATLQQREKMTPFYGPDALQSAISEAESGAVITLSPGNYGSVRINKPMTIIGSGCDDDGSMLKTVLTYVYMNADDVKIEGVYIKECYLEKEDISNAKICRCNISKLFGKVRHNNTIVDQCYISQNYSLKNGNNMCIKNSFIEKLYGGYDTAIEYEKLNTPSNPVYFSNCVLYQYYYVFIVSKNNYLYRYETPYGIYKNCILCYTDYDYSRTGSYYTNNKYYFQNYYLSPSIISENEYYNNVFVVEPGKLMEGGYNGWYMSAAKNKDLAVTSFNISWSNTQKCKGNNNSFWDNLINDNDNMSNIRSSWWKVLKSNISFKGDDGTVVGPYGATGFSIVPSIPRIVESTIDSNTNADGKLNVKIKVEVNK